MEAQADPSGQTPSRREFASQIMEGLTGAGERRVIRFREESFSLVNDGKPTGEINLKNMYAEHCSTEPAMCNDHLKQVLLALIQANYQLPEEFEDARSDLRPRIWTRATFAQMKLASQIQGNQSLERPLVPIGEHLLLGLVFDLPASMRSIIQDNLRDWDVSLYEAIEAAKYNLLESRFPLALLGDRLYVSVTGDHYDSCRILAVDLIRRLKLDGDPVAMILNRDTLFITGSDDAEGLAMMATLTAKVMEEPRPMMSTALRLVDDEWTDWLPPVGHPAYSKFKDLKVHCMQGIHDVQWEQLTQLHQAQGIDVFVASQFAVRSPEGHFWTCCVWAESIESWLPESDYIMFFWNEQSEKARVTWDQAMQTVGSLMEEIEDLYPKRFRVNSFPNDFQLQQLKANSVE